jgi:hypothetical protein
MKGDGFMVRYEREEQKNAMFQPGERMVILWELVSFSEAAKLLGKDESALRKAVADGRLVPLKDCMKYGKQWVVFRDALAREFGGYGKLRMDDLRRLRAPAFGMGGDDDV